MKRDLIYDVGMNNGDDTAYYLARGFRVVAVEAHPGLAAAGSQRFAGEIARGQLTILNVAVSESDTPLDFWVCDSYPEWSSFDRAIASRDGARHHLIQVSGQQFGRVLQQFGVPYYLKVDIEGADWLCVKALQAQDVPVYLSIEQSGMVLEHLDFFPKLGYAGFKCISQNQFLPVQLEPSDEEKRLGHFCKHLTSPALGWRIFRRLGGRRLLQGKLKELRTRGDWVFPIGSSGPFGEDTPGEWMPFEKFTRTLEHVHAKFQRGERSPYWGGEKYSFWADFHMKQAESS